MHTFFFQLSFEGIKVLSAQVNAKQPNVVTTFFKDDFLDLSHGINFGTNHKVQVRKFTFNNIRRSLATFMFHENLNHEV